MSEEIVSKKALEESQSAEAHSILGASSAYRWIECPGSVARCKWYRDTYGEKESEYAKLGTAVHAMCEYSLLHAGKDYPQEEAEGVKVDDHMLECARVYSETVLGDLRKYGGKLNVETKFDLFWLYPGMFGRNDSSIVPEMDMDILRVYDYKNGVQRVDPENNPQCMYYALGALGEGNPHAVTGVEIVIVQPNCPGKNAVERWFVDTDSLYKWAYEVLKPAAERAMKPDAPLKCGDHCMFCDYYPVCEEREKQVLDILGTDSPAKLSSVQMPEPAGMDGADLARFSRFFASKSFQKWMKAVMDEELRRLREGVPVPGRKIIEVPGRATRIWTDEKEAAETLVGSLGSDGAYIRSLLSPSQAEKAYKDRLGLKPKEVSALLGGMITSMTTPKEVVVDESDIRESVTADQKRAIELLK